MVELGAGEEIAVSFCHSRLDSRFLKYYVLGLIIIAMGVAVYAGYVQVPFFEIYGFSSMTLTSLVLVALGIIAWLFTELKKIASGRYYVTNQRIIAEKGILKTNTDAITFSMIVNIKISQNFLNKIFHIGHIEISTARGHQEIVLSGIKNPGQIENIIYKYIESHEKPFDKEQEQPKYQRPQYYPQRQPVNTQRRRRRY